MLNMLLYMYNVYVDIYVALQIRVVLCVVGLGCLQLSLVL